MQLVTTILLRNFEIELAIDPAKIREVTAFTMMPERMPVRLLPRAGAG